MLICRFICVINYRCQTGIVSLRKSMSFLWPKRAVTEGEIDIEMRRNSFVINDIFNSIINSPSDDSYVDNGGEYLESPIDGLL